jgi:hypothetical protein
VGRRTLMYGKKKKPMMAKKMKPKAKGKKKK